MKRSFEQSLIDQCAPTLAGVKPASLFRFSRGGVEAIRRSAAGWDTRLRPLGLRVRILKECPITDASVIYVYRESWVKRILADRDHRRFLEEMHYRITDLEGMLDQLSHRLCLEQDYPHEIGVFLGYPLEDVVGFISNQGNNYTCCGHWKAYGDPEAARKCFDTYRRCTSRYQKMFRKGIPILQMVVAA